MKTQIEIIKQHLKKNKTISTWEAIFKYRITRLSAHINTLRDSGVKIKSVWIKKNNKRFVKYVLDSKK